jgi:hypothetical protein
MRENSATVPSESNKVQPDPVDIPRPEWTKWADTWGCNSRGERYIRGVDYHVTDSDLTVCTSCFQNTDGSIQGDTREGEEGPRVCLDGVVDLNADQARELAALLLDLAAQIDGWVTR